MTSVIYNKIIPFKGFKAINLFGIIFARHRLFEADLTHEQIHTRQMREMLYIPFYIWYVIEWLIKLIWYHSFHKAYRNIKFEKEAYMYQYNKAYLTYRKHYSWIWL